MNGVAAAWDWGLALIAFAFGVVAGLGLAYVLLPGSRLARRALEERDALQHELDDFRRGVDDHFQKTSDLFQDLTSRYREVYDHLSKGAQTLVREPLAAARLEVPDGRLLADSSQTQGTAPQADAAAAPAEAEAAAGTAPSDHVDSAAEVSDEEAKDRR